MSEQPDPGHFELQLTEVTPRMRQVFAMMLAHRYGGTLLEEIFEALGPDLEPYPWEESRAGISEKEAERRRKESWHTILRFLNTFAGRRLDMPLERALKSVAHEAGIYLRIVDGEMSVAEVAEEKNMPVSVVEEIVSEGRRVMAAIDSPPVPKKRKRA